MLLSIVLDYTYIGQPSNQTHMLEAFHIVSVNLSFFLYSAFRNQKRICHVVIGLLQVYLSI